jgi:hypothetical protein
VRYDGQWKNDKKNGQGIITFIYEDCYDGESNDENINELNIYTLAN